MRESHLRSVLAIERVSFPSPWPESAYRYELRFGTDSHFFVLQPQGVMPAGERFRSRLWEVLQREPELPVLGYIGLRTRVDSAHISTIAVHPSLRGRGVGKFLLLALLEKALQHRAQRVTLEVRVSNFVAQRLYRKVGFVQTGMRHAYYRDGEDARLMALTLDQARVDWLRLFRRAVYRRVADVEIPWLEL
jgi:ribosomal-protein-alanine N-acetyltransferase